MVQIVLQFSPLTPNSFETLISMEYKIKKALQGQAEVDGHDIGSNEMNIFITASDPKTIIERCIPIINNLGLMNLFSSGYKQLNSESYVRIWPEGDKSEFKII